MRYFAILPITQGNTVFCHFYRLASSRNVLNLKNYRKKQKRWENNKKLRKVIKNMKIKQKYKINNHFVQ